MRLILIQQSRNSNRTISTDYGKVVVDALAGMPQESNSIDQALLRQYLKLASSYLILDATTNKESGITSWNIGFHRLVDLLIVLHRRGELQTETVNEASKACSECWSVAGSWSEIDEGRECVRQLAGKLKTLLDSNGRTYQGNPVYAP